MKTMCKGVSTGNILINELASMAKNNLLSKLFYVLFMLIGTQVAYCDNITFTFLYGSGISKMEYKYPYNYFTSQDANITVSATSSQLAVNIAVANLNGDDGETDIFDSTYSSNNRLGLKTTAANASDLDVLMSGMLIINGKPVSSDFALAHEHKSHDWWLGNNFYSSLYKSGAFTAMTLKDDYGNYYCLNQNGTNYEVIVTAGSCYPTDFSNAVVKGVEFYYKNPNYSVDFEYNGNHDDLHNNADSLVTISSTDDPTTAGDFVSAWSKLYPESGIALSFNNKLGNSTSTMMKLNQSTTVQSLPNKLDYWFEGPIYFNNQLITSDLTLALDPDGETWWVGSKYAKVISNNKLQIGKFCLQSLNNHTIYITNNYCSI